MAFDYDTYAAASPDVVAYAVANGLDPAVFLPQHYQTTGQYEIAEGLRGGAPAAAADSYSATQGDDGWNFQVNAPQAAADPYAVSGVPDFGMYSGSSGQYQAPELLTNEEGNPYYAAYTNDNDLAGRVMVGQGQKIRLVDQKTGDIVFEGEGPEAAAQATAIANAVSEDKGRKAAWVIQADDYGGGNWTTQAAERYDPKDSGILGTVLDIAAPFILSALLPGVGTALAGTLGSLGGAAASAGLANLGSGLIQGESLGTALKGAAVSGLTAGALKGVSGIDALKPVTDPINSGLGKVQGVFNDVLAPVRTLIDPLNDGLSYMINGAGDVVDSLGNMRNDLRGVLFGGEGAEAVAGGVGADALPGTVEGITVMGGGVSPSVGIPTGGFEVEGVDVTARPQQDTPLGVDLDGLPTDVEGIEVVARPDEPTLPTDVEEVVSTGRPPTTPTVDLEGVTVTANPPIVSPPGVPLAPPGDVEIVNPPPQLPDTFTPFPEPTAPGIPSPAQPATAPNWTSGNAGTRASLDPIFSKALPPPTFGTRTPRANVDVDNRYAIDRPEQSFFVNVPQLGPSRFSVNSPVTQLLAGIGDLDGDGIVNDADRRRFRSRYNAQGYADGGEVEGPGDGRSDSIPADLSDGEYVIDAETVALLGNGSSKAGADALDRFRVNIRRDKGRDLAKGRFSVAAKVPEAYMGGR